MSGKLDQTLATVVKAVVLRRLYRRARRGVNRLRYFGFRRHCPCCDSSLARFRSFGLVLRPEALCPVCGSLERHRLICLYIQARTNLFDGHHKRMLHVAPEEQLSRFFRSAEYIDYLSSDLQNPTAMVKMDITDIHYPARTFDAIYCSHVLEHVLEDTKAISEFHRVLKPGGWAILQVPITVARTIEDPTIISPAERERVFGQTDHVRRYGPDYRDRLIRAGFLVKIDGFVRELGNAKIRRYGLMESEDVYFCRRDA